MSCTIPVSDSSISSMRSELVCSTGELPDRLSVPEGHETGSGENPWGGREALCSAPRPRFGRGRIICCSESAARSCRCCRVTGAIKGISSRPTKPQSHDTSANPAASVWPMPPVRLIGQYDLSKPVQTLDQGMVLGTQNDPYGCKGVGVDVLWFRQQFDCPATPAVYHCRGEGQNPLLTVQRRFVGQSWSMAKQWRRHARGLLLLRSYRGNFSQNRDGNFRRSFAADG